jgi:hypothetical protein
MGQVSRENGYLGQLEKISVDRNRVKKTLIVRMFTGFLGPGRMGGADDNVVDDMQSLSIALGAGPERAEREIILAKTLVYDDFRAAYGGATVGFAGILMDSVPAAVPPSRSLVASDEQDRAGLLVGIAEAFLSRSGGYIDPLGLFSLISRARLDGKSRPLAFYSLSDHRGCLERFLLHCAREGFILPGQRTLTMGRPPADEEAPARRLSVS